MERAQDIVDTIFAGNKALAIELIHDALTAKSLDAVEAHKPVVASTWFSDLTDSEEEQ
jgi:hypothetical protein